MTASQDALSRLPADARIRLEAFAAALEQVPVDQFGLFADRTWDDEHRAAVERSRAVAEDARLSEPILAAQRALADGIVRLFASSALHVTTAGANLAHAHWPGSDADRRRILDSLADAVTALVLGDRIDPEDHAELLGLWARVLPET